MPPRPNRAPLGVLAWHQDEIGHQLARITEAGKIADLDDHRHGIDQSDAAHCLDRTHNRRHRPIGQERLDLPRQSVDPSLGIGHGMDVIFKHDQLRAMIKANGREPARIGLRPTPKTRIKLAMPQQR
jgi:hypothetical protein